MSRSPFEFIGVRMGRSRWSSMQSGSSWRSTP